MKLNFFKKEQNSELTEKFQMNQKGLKVNSYHHQVICLLISKSYSLQRVQVVASLVRYLRFSFQRQRLVLICLFLNLV